MELQSPDFSDICDDSSNDSSDNSEIDDYGFQELSSIPIRRSLNCKLILFLL